ncbi:6-phosphogluconolactonase [Capsulimonas corticalis]|uniref:6-phosphogluconolactonase n=1 Tax=Capsulimonas corticalis TaxID=2219043 RepID=A0A402D2A5_9BACT|nr:lactonase family protein [Capsulimonas corticalis]BDI30188.1 6-phosphogluconolactonase [Capsulimonas corticalis]
MTPQAALPRFLTLCAFLVTMMNVSITPASSAEMFVYFGSHGKGPGIGFSLARFNTDTGQLTIPTFLQECVAPSYFVISHDGKRLYTCNSDPGSSVSAYAIDPATAKLTLLNEQPSGGGEPCYISLDATGHTLMVANYGPGNVAAFALKDDGSIGERTAFSQHTGSSVNPQRQEGPHAHSIHVDPTNKFVLSADLGADKLFVYRLDPKTGALTPNDPPFAAVAPGSGPRHFAFHPDGHDVYLINEMGNSIVHFGWDSHHGVLTPHETVSTLPEGFQGTSFAAEILIHPDGKFLYATNRGDNTVAVFSIEAKTGRLTLIQNIPTQGKFPRNCELDPTGRWLLVSNHDSNNAIVFHIDPKTGKLTQTGEPVAVPAPFCERFLPIR